ncbi:motor activity protein [Homalodisca vitripennis]|nr:motor activity protein [Homalodisca vitripennis]
MLNIEREKADLSVQVISLSERLEEAEGGAESQFEINKKRDTELNKLRRLLEDVHLESEETASLLRKKHQEVVNDFQEQLDQLAKAKASQYGETGKQVVLVCKTVEVKRRDLEISQPGDKFDVSIWQKLSYHIEGCIGVAWSFSICSDCHKNGKDKSRCLLVTVGVPQGSILDPLLFIVRFNDPNKSIKSHLVQYADDTSVAIQAESPNTLATDLSSTKYQVMKMITPSSLGQQAKLWRRHICARDLGIVFLIMRSTSMSGTDFLRTLNPVIMSSSCRFYERTECLHDGNYTTPDEGAILGPAVADAGYYSALAEKMAAVPMLLTDKEKQKFQQEVYELLSQIESSSKEKIVLVKQVEKLEVSIHEMNIRVEELNRTVIDITSHKTRLSQENIELVKEVQDLKVNIENATYLKSQLAGQLEDARRRLEDDERRRSLLEASLRQVEVELESVRVQLEEEAEARLDLERQLVKANGEVSLYKSKYETEAHARAEEVEELRRKYSARLQEQEEHIESLVVKINSLEKQKSRLQSEVEVLIIDLEKANNTARELQKRVEQLERINIDLKSRLEETSALFEQTQRDLRNKQAELQRVNHELEKTREQKDSLTRENKKLSDDLHDARNTLAEMNRRLHELELELRRLENEREELTAAYKEAEAGRKAEESRSQRLAAELGQFRHEAERRLQEKDEEIESIRGSTLSHIVCSTDDNIRDSNMTDIEKTGIRDLQTSVKLIAREHPKLCEYDIVVDKFSDLGLNRDSMQNY